MKKSLLVSLSAALASSVLFSASEKEEKNSEAVFGKFALKIKPAAAILSGPGDRIHRSFNAEHRKITHKEYVLRREKKASDADRRQLLLAGLDYLKSSFGVKPVKARDKIDSETRAYYRNLLGYAGAAWGIDKSPDRSAECTAIYRQIIDAEGSTGREKAQAARGLHDLWQKTKAFDSADKRLDAYRDAIVRVCGIKDLSKGDVNSLWSDYAFRSWRAHLHDRVEDAYREVTKAGGKFVSYAAQRCLQGLKIYEDFKKFPKNEKDIVFPKGLEDFGIKHTKTVYAVDFGWNPTNATKCLQSAIDSGATRVVVGKTPSPWRIDSIRARSNQEVVFEKGVRILSDITSTNCNRRTLFWGKNATNVVFIGLGEKPEDVNIAKYESFDERMDIGAGYGGCGFSFDGCENVLVKNLRVSNCSMDGLNFTGLGKINSNQYFVDLVLDNNNRQACSIVNGESLYFKNVKFINTKFKSPACGIDCEPAIEVQANAGIYLFDCEFSNNYGGGLNFTTSSWHPISFYAKRCRFNAHLNRGALIVFARAACYMRENVKAPAKIIIEESDIEGYSDVSPVMLEPANIFDIELKNCRIKDIGRNARASSEKPASPILFDFDHGFYNRLDWKDYAHGGSLSLNGVTVSGYKGASLVKIIDRPGHPHVGGISGSVTFNGEKTDASSFCRKAGDGKSVAAADETAKKPASAEKAKKRRVKFDVPSWATGIVERVANERREFAKKKEWAKDLENSLKFIAKTRTSKDEIIQREGDDVQREVDMRLVPLSALEKKIDAEDGATAAVAAYVQAFAAVPALKKRSLDREYFAALMLLEDYPAKVAEAMASADFIDEMRVSLEKAGLELLDEKYVSYREPDDLRSFAATLSRIVRFDPRHYGRIVRNEARRAIQKKEHEKALSLLERSHRLDPDEFETSLLSSGVYLRLNRVDEAVSAAEKAFSFNAAKKARTFHCTGALMGALMRKGGWDLALPRFREIIRDWKKYMPEEKDISTVLSSYGLTAYRGFRYDELKWCLAEYGRHSLPIGGYKYRIFNMLKSVKQMETFPRDEKDIVFPKTLADFGVADTNTVHAKDFGWNAEDATKCLQKALDSGATTVIVDKMPSPWRIYSVSPKSNQRILFKDGVVVLAERKTREENTKNLDMIKLDRVSNVIIEGEGSAYLGKYENAAAREKYVKKYGGSGIGLSRTTNVAVRNLKIAECSMDGILWGGPEPYNLETFVENVTIDHCYRQAVSICNADGVYFRNVKFLNTEGGAPTAGMDLEPAIECYPDSNIYLYDCVFEGNKGGGLVFYTSTYAPVTLHAKRCSFLENGHSPVEVFARCGIYLGADRKAPSKILIEDSLLRTYSDTCALNIQSCSLFDVTLRNCRMLDNGRKANPTSKAKGSPVGFSLNRDFGPGGIPDHLIGKVKFENVTADGWKGASLVRFSDELGMLDIKNVLVGDILFNGVKTDSSKFEYTAPDRTSVPMTLPDFAKFPPPTRKVAADYEYELSNMDLSRNGAWFQQPPVYTILYWAERGREVTVNGETVKAEKTGWHAFRLKGPNEKFFLRSMKGAVPVFMSDVSGCSMAKFVMHDTRKGYTGYFIVPGGKKGRLRLTWGGLSVANPAGEIIDSVRLGDYVGRFYFDIASSGDKCEVWSFTTPPGPRTRVLRFYAPLTGYWADDPRDLPAFDGVNEKNWKKLVEANAARDAEWSDTSLAEGLDFGFLPPATAARLNDAVLARRRYAEAGAGAKALAETRLKMERILKAATTEANLRDANEERKNIVPLERRAAMEKRIVGESAALLRLASAILLSWDTFSSAEKERSGVEVFDGQIDYRRVKDLVSLYDILKKNNERKK